ncbi:Lrp/AsnC family transcriptional regulator [Brevibacterium otitidis]|uniref:Lrp/AsnC family transcriptional regulator n=1 Tax=Brevibacterium otitidis TaxID=53364 RepID=A0ABV5X5A2_9MICO|nr:Lrp/AsnC family transcriptional regulator [Brevibacterium otitidis]
MDSTDRAIIDLLTLDGRLSNTELADKIGLTPSPCLRRVRRLESEGIITGYHARIDPAAIDRACEVIVHVDMGTKTKQIAEAFEGELIDCDEVIELRRMFGNPDYLVRIAVKDLEAAEQFISQVLTGIDGVERVNSHITMKVLKAPL